MKRVERGVLNLYLRYIAELLEKLSIDEACVEVQACKPYAEHNAPKAEQRVMGVNFHNVKCNGIELASSKCRSCRSHMLYDVCDS